MLLTNPSLGENFACCQIFVGQKSYYSKTISMTTESSGCDALGTFIAEVGATFHIMSDYSKLETSKAWKSILRKYSICSSTKVPYHWHQMRYERYIQELKKITTRLMDHKNTPDYLWYEALQYASTIHNHTSKLMHKTPIEKVFGTTPDISALLQCSFMDSSFIMKQHSPIKANYLEDS